MNGVSAGEFLERSDCRERRRVAIFPEKKEQNDSAIEKGGREFGSGLEEFRWRSWFMVFQRRRGFEDRD
jgi:hypothetical protein